MLGAILCCYYVAIVHGFQPNHPTLITSNAKVSRSWNEQRVPFQLMATASSETKNMTEEDEDILFSSALDPNPPFPARHRHKSRTGNLLVDANQPINSLDHSPNNPLINKLRTTRDTLNCCPAIWSSVSKLCPDEIAIIDDYHCDTKITAFW